MGNGRTNKRIRRPVLHLVPLFHTEGHEKRPFLGGGAGEQGGAGETAVSSVFVRICVVKKTAVFHHSFRRPSPRKHKHKFRKTG
ncbi:MAG: hypothetical protein R3C62_17975 [Chloroflexota bacterium]